MRPHRHIAAALVAAAVAAAGCSSGSPDADRVADVPPATVENLASEPAEGSDGTEAAEPAGGPDGTEAAQPAEGGPDGTEAAEPAEGGPDDAAAVVAEPTSDRADLGGFDDYVPADPDPTLLGVDPDVLIGTLDNGLRYYLRPNATPAESLEMRLVVDAGALVDPPGAEGVAHFVEHMLFNGTEQFSHNELGQALRSIGTESGPDLNAYTSADETVYMLDLALDDPEALNLAFTVLSQWATAATIRPADVEAERGIVADEYRLRNESANGRISHFLDAIYYRGTVYEGMLIGGSEQSIASITAEQLREFYDTWYRPDNMAVVVVGDLPAAEMQRKVEEHFGALAARADALPAQPERHTFTAAFVTEPVTDAVTHPDYGDISMSIDWQLPAWPPSTVGGDRLRYMESLIALMLDIRLDSAFRASLMSQASEPYLSLWQEARGLRLYGTNLRGPDLAQATTDYLSVVEGAAHYGFTADELEQATTATRTALEAHLERAETASSSAHANDYAAHFVRGEGIAAAADRVARLGALLDTFTVEEMTAHLRWLLEGAPPLVVSLGDDPANVPNAAELRAAIDAAAPVAPPEPEEPIQALMAPPDPVPAVGEHALGLFEGAHEWVFANGARVVFAPSVLAANQVSLTAQGLGGWSLLPPGGAALRRSVVAAVAASGVGEISATQLDGYLAATTARLSPYLGEHTEGFSGSASPDDLDDLLALLHLHVTEPRVTQVAADEQIQELETRRTRAENLPAWIAAFAMWDAYYQNSPWYKFIATPQQIDAATPASLLDLYRARLGDVDDLVVVIVGDTDQDTVAELAARYIGTLPAGAPDSYIDHNPGFPPGIQRITIPVDADAGASGLDILFGARVPVSAKTLVIADVTSALLDDLLIGAVREQLGETFAVDISMTPYIEVGTWENIISATGASYTLEQSHAAIIDIIAELTEHGPAQDDLAQAKSVARDNYQLDNNSEITSPLLRRRHLHDALVGTPPQLLEALAEVTAADIQRYMLLLFDLDNRIEVFRTTE